MIHLSAVGYVLGQFLLALAATMLIPLAYGWITGSEGLLPLVYGALITAGSALLLIRFAGKPDRELTRREGLLLVVSVWGAVGLFGSIPFYLSPYFSSFTDAFFESISGFSTTGATILERVEVLPKPCSSGDAFRTGSVEWASLSWASLFSSRRSRWDASLTCRIFGR